MNIKAIIFIHSCCVVVAVVGMLCFAARHNVPSLLFCFCFAFFFLHDLREQPGRWAPNVPPSEAVMEGTAKNRRTVALLRMRAATAEGLG